jgi:hypothetical protein
MPMKRLFSARKMLFIPMALGLLLAPARVAWAAPVISDVQPRTVSNTASATIVVTGAGFETGSVVVVDGIGALATTPISGTVIALSAVIPAGAPLGTYTVKVVNPDGSSGSLSNALTIVGPTATPAPTAFARPLLVVQSYGASSVEIPPGVDLDFEMTLINMGQANAVNVVATFPSGDFVPRVTGGVRALGTITPGQTARFFQPLASTTGIAGRTIATLDVKVSYNDVNGTAYDESFTLTFPVQQPGSGAPAKPTSTPTPRPVFRPQLLVTRYSADAPQLQPGGRFTLNLEIQNVGNANARRVTAIVGGGTSTGTTGGATGTAQPGGGVSGAGGEFTDFAPVDSSNVQFLGDVNAGAGVTLRQALIVNASTKAGAYTLKLSFAYTDEKNNAFTDDQVITLLVYQPPTVQMGFYRETGPLFAGQSNALPLQIVNLGRNSAVLGNLKVASSQEGAQFTNNVTLVGALDPGGFFTLDAIVIPAQPGPLDLIVSVDYTDDFNQPQTISQTLSVEVMEGGGPIIEPGGEGPGEGGFPVEPTPTTETFWQKVLRFFLGLIGLDSGQPASGGGEGIPPPGEVQPPEVLPSPKG